MVCGIVGCETVYVLYFEVFRVRNLLAFIGRLQARWSLFSRDVARGWGLFRANRNGDGVFLRNVLVALSTTRFHNPEATI